MLGVREATEDLMTCTDDEVKMCDNAVMTEER